VVSANPDLQLQEGSQHLQFSTPANKVALIAVFTALSLGTNYAMIDIPNVKLMDAIVFIAAFLFGLDVGLGSAVSIWIIYGFINPWGQAGFPLLFFLIGGECFYAIAGGFLRRTSTGRQMAKNGGYRHATILFGGLGLLTTFAYDAITNFASFLFLTNSLYQAFLIGMITGAPFALFHELSNLFFFATIVPGAIYAAGRFRLGVEQ
jgi:hypothetical protein